jgi:hypothetical protein
MAGKVIILAVVLVGLVFSAAPASAATPTPYSTHPADPPSAVFLTAVQVNGVLDYAEIYNSSEVPANMAGWKVSFSTVDGELCEIALQDWLRPEGYGLIGEQSIITGDDNFLSFDTADCGLTITQTTYIDAIYLVEDSVIRDSLTLSDTHDNESWVRRTTTTSSNTLRRTNDFAYDFEKSSAWSKRPQVYTGGWYAGPPADVEGLQILEILANSRKCSPIEIDLTCGDYVKLYNPTNHEINLADYRLRIGYQGQSASVTNTFTWGLELQPELEEYILPPGEYFMLTVRNDGNLVSITDSGGYVWLEDYYGAVVYGETIIKYPDASSTTKEGWAWAFDGKEWKWTSSPQPYAPNDFPPPEPEQVTPASSLVPCRPDQYRNPATNRCKLIASASSSLVPCKPGQQRNPDTNRCRSVAGASTTLEPCGPGQERNPATNRCRKIVDTAEAAYKVEEIPTNLSSNMGWWVAGAVGAGAIGYGTYEWRRELLGLLGKAKGIFSK